jgi:hypothetical protein
MFATGEAPPAIIEREGLKQISDTGALEQMIDEVIAANPKQVEQYRGGKTTVINFLVGQVMKATRGQANVARGERNYSSRNWGDYVESWRSGSRYSLHTDAARTVRLSGLKGKRWCCISIPRPIRRAARWKPASSATAQEVAKEGRGGGRHLARQAGGAGQVQGEVRSAFHAAGR